MIIYYHTGPVGAEISGSTARPTRMQQAMINVGDEVFTIAGDRKTRQRLQKELLEKISGDFSQITGLYFENTSSPLGVSFLRLSRLLPGLPKRFVVPLVLATDKNFFRLLHQHQVKMSVFYRDIYWDYPMLFDGNRSQLEIKFLKHYYRKELAFYAEHFHCMYVPSHKFTDKIPAPYRHPNTLPLPPGTQLSAPHESVEDKPYQLNILYVGGIGPAYDPTVFFQAMQQMPDVLLTLCTRYQEWLGYSSKVPKLDNLVVASASGDGLNALYRQCDIAVHFGPPGGYLDIAMPVKIFEYIARRVPIICFAGTAFADMIAEHDLGWVVAHDADAVVTQLKQLRSNPQEIARVRDNMATFSLSNSWETRAQQVLNDFSA